MMVYIFCILMMIAGIVSYFTTTIYILLLGAVWIWSGGLLLLAYGLIRDIILILSKRREQRTVEKKSLAIICFESVLGGMIVAAGLLLQFLGWSPFVQISLGTVLILGAIIIVFGHYTRDWVFILAKVKDHHNIIPCCRISELDVVENSLRSNDQE